MDNLRIERYPFTMYLHERENWTDFKWDERTITPLLSAARFAQGKLLGRLEDIGFDLSQEAEIRSLSSEVIASSGIEGVELDAVKVRSSVARRLGADQLIEEVDTRDVDGAVDVTMDAVKRSSEPLDAERLFGWHAALFSTGYSRLHRIEVATYRTSPMEVVSGPIGHERIHYKAPDARDVPGLMDDFIGWFNAESGEDSLVKAALAHLRFLTIHPFDDGNGRIARALTESLLAQSDGSTRRFYSMASYIIGHRGEYYETIERAQKGTSTVTQWLEWFLPAITASVEDSERELRAVLARSVFWTLLEATSLNARQRKMLSLLVGDFEGKLTAKKWAKICKVSDDTALRDINDLIAKGVLVRDAAGGRSSSYSLAESAQPVS